MILSQKHLLGLKGMPRQDIDLILNHAVSFKEILERPIKKVPTLRGKTIVNLFFENSTRTRISFELAEKRLSGDTINFSANTSSMKKGETLRDTARNIEAMRIEIIVVRHPAVGVPYFLAQCTKATIINAGDGTNEHPSQALLDIFTLKEKFKELKDLRVVIIGDILHSRVARSNIWGLKTMGARVAVCGPSTLLPLEMKEFGVDVYTDLNRAIADADVLYILRLQMERQNSGLLPSLREYRERFGINKQRLKKVKPSLVILHPGPINRGLELSSEVADGEFSLILDQVTNGVAVRMAILYLLGGGDVESSGV